MHPRRVMKYDNKSGLKFGTPLLDNTYVDYAQREKVLFL